MQYLWKVTVLGLSQQVYRLVSLDCNLPLDSVLSLCNLSFDYDNYPDKALYFAQNAEGKLFCESIVPEDDGKFGGNKVSPEFWQRKVELEPLVESKVLVKVDLNAKSIVQLQNATDVVEEHLSLAYASELKATLDCEPNVLDVKPKFFYMVHGVVHLVEVMKSSQKLMCFVPATLAGRGLVSDEQGDLALSSLEACLAQQSQREEQYGEEIVLDLRACTGRMRALRTEVDAAKVNQVMVQAGATPLKFEH